MTGKRNSLQDIAAELAIINWKWRFQKLTSEIVFAKQIGPERFLQAWRCNFKDTGTGQIIERSLSDSEFISEIQDLLSNPKIDPFFFENFR
jgi:hypothetical protein